MNKIYKLVWSKVRNTWVVTSEIAKGHGKESSSGRNGKRLKLAVMTAILGGCFMTAGISPVAALTDDQQAVYDAVMAELNAKRGVAHYFSVNSDDKNAPEGTNYDNNGATGKDAIAIGKNAVSEGPGSIAIGRGSKIFNTSQSLGMAIGDGAEAAHGSIVIGKNARDYDTDPKKGAFGIFIGSEAKSFGGSSQTVVGYQGQAKGQGSTAIGSGAHALGGQSSAVGENSQALQQGAAAFGTNSIAEFDESTALGSYANGRGNKSVASGNKSVAAGHNSVAIGYQTFAHNGFIDRDAYNALSPEEQKKYFEASGMNAYFLKDAADGNDAKKIGDTYLNTAVGSYSNAYKHATTLGGRTSAKEEGTAVGTYAKAYKKGAASLGYKAQSNAENGVALGAYSFADREKGKIGYALGGDNSTLEKALESAGQKAKYDELTGKIAPLKDEYNGFLKAYLDAPRDSAEKTTAKQKLDAWVTAHPDFLPAVQARKQMTDAWQSGNGAVSVGSAGATRQITNVAAGSEDTDAVNVAQLKALNNKVDNGAIHYFSVKSDDSANPAGTNWNNDGAKGTNDIAIGKEAAATGGFGFAAGHQAKASGNADIAIGPNAEATGGWGVAIGQEAKAQASTAVAMAFDAKAKGANSLAIGVQSEARTDDSTAYGRGAKALGQVALAVGTLTKAEGNHSSVFGFKATTDSTAWNGTAIGRGAYIGKQAPDGTTPDIGVSDNYYMPVDDDTAVEAGKETKNSTAVGFGAKSFGYQNTAVGAGAEAFDTNTVAVGVMSKAIGHYANALGKQARAEGKDSIAIGHFARAIGESSTALGDYAITSTLDGKKGVSKSVAVGSHARAASDNSIALGNNSLANIADDVKTEAYLSKETFKKENGVVSVGNKEYTVGNEKIEQNYRRITNVAGGADDHDAVNVAQLKALDKRVTDKLKDVGGVHYFSVVSDPADETTSGGTNWKNDGAKGVGSMAIGRKASTDGEWNTAVGFDANAKGEKNTAIGVKSSANGEEALAVGVFAKAEGLHATAIGAQSNAKGIASTAFGQYSKAEGLGATAFGFRSNVTSEGGLALGPNSVVTAKFGTAIGLGAIAMQEEGVALGTQSLANRAPQMPGYTPVGKQWSDFQDYLTKTGQKDAYDQANQKLKEAKQALSTVDPNHRNTPEALELVAKYQQAGKELNDIFSTWAGAKGAVSIGNESVGMTRQLTGLAAGTKDTDAVNVAQLKALANAPMGFDIGGKLENNVYTPGAKNWTMPLNGLRMSFGDGLLAEEVTDKDGKKYTLVKMNDEITLGKDGKDGKIGINGKDGKSAEITVGKGEPGVDGQDGVTRIIYKDKEGKEHEVATLDDGLKFKGDNDTVVTRKLNQQLNITGGIKNAADLSDGNIGIVGTQDGGMEVKLSKKLKGLTSAEFKDGDNITNITAGDISITKKEGDKTKTLNIWELKEKVETNAKATKVTVGGKEENADGNLKITKKTVDGQTTYDLSLNDELTIGKDGKDGKIGINGKDGKSAEITVGKGEPGVDGQDGVTRIIYKDKEGKEHEVATLDDGLKFKGDNDTVVTRKLNQQLNITGGIKNAADLSDGNIGIVGTQDGGMEVKLSKKLKGLTSAEFKDGDKVTNITAGNVTITRKEGNETKTVNLWELNNTVNNITNGTTDVSSWKLQANGAGERTITKDSVVNFKNGANTEVTVDGNDITVDLNAATKKQINDNTTKIDNIDQRVTTIENNIDQKIEGAKITVQGDKDTGVNATEVKGADGKVTGYKVSLEKKVQVGNVTIDGTGEGTDKKGEITGLTNTTVDAADFATKGRAATEEQLKAAMDNVKTQSRTTVKGKGNITVTPETEGASKYTVELAKDITVDSVTAKTIKADEYKVGDKTYINKDGINANGNKITNVGDGKISKDSTDAVNGKQLYGVEQKVNQNTTNINKLQNNIYDMGMKVGELDTRVNKVGAGAAALAALHPQDFDPEDKWDIAAGVGNYKNATAAAVGLFYRPNERTMLNLGWTMGDSRNMVNAGVSVKLGSGSTYAGLSKVQMATRLTQQEEKITAQEQEIKELREREEQREKQIQEILSKLEMIEKAKA